MGGESEERGFAELLNAAGRGEPSAADAFVVELYGELRRLAAARLARSPQGGRGQTLQPTALVHEAFIRLLGKDAEYESQRHFFFAAARAMQDILVEQARRKARRARAGAPVGESPDEGAAIESPPNVIALSQALERLQGIDPRKADLVRLRFFAGLTVAQAAQVMGLSVPTLEREWRLARSILFVQLREGASDA